MLAVINGGLGSGKTLFLTIMGKLTEKPLVVANYHLGFEYTKFDLRDFIAKNYSNCIVLIDEAYSLLESRNFMSSENQVLSYVLFQSRKKNMDLYLTVQLNSTLDIRFRELADIYVSAEGLRNIEGEIYFKYKIWNSGKITNQYLKYSDAEKYFELYNTDEVISPMSQNEILDKLKSPKEKIIDSRKLAIEIFEKYPAKMKFRKDDIKLYLSERNLPVNMVWSIYTIIQSELLPTRILVKEQKSISDYTKYLDNLFKNWKKKMEKKLV